MKPKFIEDEQRLDYKAKLKEFMRELNPDLLTEEQIEKLKKEYLSRREK